MNDGTPFRQAFPDGGVSAAETVFQRTLTLLNMGRPADALREATLALASEPEHAGLLQLACAAQTALGQNHEARRLAERLLAVAPQSDVAHRLYAINRWNAGQRDRVAIQSAERAVALDPDDVGNRTTLAFMLMQRRRYAEARGQLSTALGLTGSAESLAYAHALLGDLALRQRRPAQAEQHAREALRLEPHAELGLQIMALAQLRSRQAHEAIRTARSAVQQEPADPTRAHYLRLIVDEYLPHPLGARTWSLIALPWGIGVLVSLGLALTLTVRNARRWAKLPADLRAAVQLSRRDAPTPPERFRWSPLAVFGLLLALLGALFMLFWVVAGLLALSAMFALWWKEPSVLLVALAFVGVTTLAVLWRRRE